MVANGPRYENLPAFPPVPTATAYGVLAGLMVFTIRDKPADARAWAPAEGSVR